MKRSLTVLICLLLSPLTGCSTDSETTAVTPGSDAVKVSKPKPAPTLTTQAISSTLVSRYGRWQGKMEKYDEVMYRPRQFAAGLDVDQGISDYGTQVVANPGLYGGWDALSLPNLYSVTLQSEPEGVHFTLNRAARVGLIWRAGSFKPAWLSGWTPGGNVTFTRGSDTLTYPVFTKDFAAGTVNLPSIGFPGEEGTQNYSVIVAEQGGTPTPAPSVPDGKELPRANAACPAWVHDQYVATGPDGKTYPTWHPQIDPQYWCYFGHEHGSDPKLAGVDASGKALYTPLFGYTAAQHGMTEPHAGFKSHVFRNTDGTWWNVTVHMGSAGLGRVCTRFHTLDLGITDSKTLKADLHLMGDFGRARYFEASNVVKLVSGCPVDQESIRDMGSRTLGSPNTDGYEPWVVDNEYNVTGLAPRFLSVKQTFPMTRCKSVPDCTSLENLAAIDPIHSGSDRLLEFVDTSVKAGNFGQNTGVFYTDPAGEKFMQAGEMMAVRQFVAAGFSSTLTRPPNPTGYCTAREAWQVEFRCQETDFLTGDKNIERSLHAPN